MLRAMAIKNIGIFKHNFAKTSKIQKHLMGQIPKRCNLTGISADNYKPNKVFCKNPDAGMSDEGAFSTWPPRWESKYQNA